MKLFNLDSPLMQALNKVADLMWLNVLTIVCCLPIVSVGASLTAMNYMALKIVRDEECYVTKGFFKSFKQNFKQATVIWLILLAVALIFAGDFWILRTTEMSYGNILQVVIMVCTILVLIAAMFVFPVLAKFDNTVFKTIKNAFIIGIMQFPKTVLMIILYAIPLLLFIFFVPLMPICLMFGLSVPAWCAAKLYNKFFKKLEAQILGNEESEQVAEDGQEDERIFRDELDPALTDKNRNQ